MGINNLYLAKCACVGVLEENSQCHYAISNQEGNGGSGGKEGGLRSMASVCLGLLGRG